VTKGQRLVNINGTLESTIELDPFGGDTNRSVNASFQPRHSTTYERDTVGGMDEAMARRYHGWWSRFSQPDPYDFAYSLADPQSFNRYAYVQSDPVNFVDPTGLQMCAAEYSYSECGGGAGFWGGGFGSHVADHNLQYGSLPPNIVSGLTTHNERVANAQGGNGYRTYSEIVRDVNFQIGYTVYSDGSYETNFNIGLQIYGNPLAEAVFGNLDSWPPWPRGDRTFGWGERTPNRVEVRGGPPINTTPTRGTLIQTASISPGLTQTILVFPPT